MSEKRQGMEQRQSQISPEVMAIIEAMNRSNREAMLDMVRELRKPSPEEAKKQAEEHAKQMEKERGRIERLRTELQAEEMKRKTCSHSRVLNGKIMHLWRGQVNSGNGTVTPVCQECHCTFPPFKATEQQKINGVNMERMQLSVESLTRAHKHSYPEGCDRKNCFICYPAEHAKAKGIA